MKTPPTTATPTTPTSATPPTIDAKPDAAKPDAAKPDAAKPPTGAPEKYESYKVPDGFELDSKVSEEANGIFKGMNLSQDQAQSLVDFYVKHTKEAAEAPFKAYTDMRQSWQQEAYKDTELGTGQSLKPEVKEAISRTLDSLGEAGTAFRQAMDLTGAGDHPAVLKAMFAISKMLIEGKHVSGTGASPQGQGKPAAVPTPAQALYPNLPSAS